MIITYRQNFSQLARVSDFLPIDNTQKNWTPPQPVDGQGAALIDITDTPVSTSAADAYLYSTTNYILSALYYGNKYALLKGVLNEHTGNNS